jgi:cell wall assembly regulator SMI1
LGGQGGLTVIEETWEQIHAWLSQHAPHLTTMLAAPAPEAEAVEAEAVLGARFPQEFRDSLRIHDGETEDEAWLFASHSLLPLRFIVNMWTDLGQLPLAGLDGVEGQFPAELKFVEWSRLWIPVAYDGAGGYLHLDLDPSPSGVAGQVIQTTSEGEYRLVAPSFGAFLALFLKHLRRGTFELYEGRLEANTGHWWV